MYMDDSIIIFNSLLIHTVLYAKISVNSQEGQPIQELNISYVCYLSALALRVSLVRGGGTSLDLISFNQ